MDDLICDKCGSPNITQRLKEKPKAPAPRKMSEYVSEKKRNPSGVYMDYSVMTYHTYIVECNHCGYTLEFTSA